jgi:hydroxymethylpyrimidine pyrophosphatase-like HAD family hydrolase
MDWAAGESGELTQENVHKGKAILELALYLGVSQKDTIAIGDSANDMEMLETAGVGIAMGNASPEVKDAADEVTGSVREEGVYQAFVKHGLSSPYDDLQMEK